MTSRSPGEHDPGNGADNQDFRERVWAGEPKRAWVELERTWGDISRGALKPLTAP
jgi:hypothetical protein